MTDIKWGPAIAVDGKRPGWLGDDQEITGTYPMGTYRFYHGSPTPAGAFDWFSLVEFRLPADHPHYRQTEKVTGGDLKVSDAHVNAAPIDWRGELEAVHEDGRTIGVKVIREGSDGAHLVAASCSQPPKDWEDGYHKFDGTSFAPDDPWRIRNVPQPTPQADTKPDLTARMEALVRYMEKGAPDILAQYPAETTGLGHAYSEAVAIYELMNPSVDPDLIEARRMAANISIEGYMWHQINDGMCDDNPLVMGLASGIKRGRALALAGEKEA